MIRVLVELWPGGNPARQETIGQVLIMNETPARDPADYVAVVLDGQWREFAVQTVRHERAAGWPALLRDVLAPASQPPEPRLVELAQSVVRHVLDSLNPPEPTAGEAPTGP